MRNIPSQIAAILIKFERKNTFNFLKVIKFLEKKDPIKTGDDEKKATLKSNHALHSTNYMEGARTTLMNATETMPLTPRTGTQGKFQNNLIKPNTFLI